MKKLAFHSLFRLKHDYRTNSHYLIYTLLLKVGRMSSFELGSERVKKLAVSTPCADERNVWGQEYPLPMMMEIFALVFIDVRLQTEFQAVAAIVSNVVRFTNKTKCHPKQLVVRDTLTLGLYASSLKPVKSLVWSPLPWKRSSLSFLGWY